VRVGNEGPRPQNNDYNKLILKINEVPIVKKSKAKIQKAYIKTICAIHYGNILHFRILSPPV
jgi:hypothetical protein